MPIPRDDFVVTRACPLRGVLRADAHARLCTATGDPHPCVVGGLVRRAGSYYMPTPCERPRIRLVQPTPTYAPIEIRLPRRAARDGRAVARKRSDELVSKTLH
jgi:hypothetical protein